MLELAFRLGYRCDSMHEYAFYEYPRFIQVRNVTDPGSDSDTSQFDRELIEFNSVHHHVRVSMPTNDALPRAAMRMEALNVDYEERLKLLLFFKWSEFGKGLGVDIVQTHILPRVIVLGGDFFLLW